MTESTMLGHSVIATLRLTNQRRKHHITHDWFVAKSHNTATSL